MPRIKIIIDKIICGRVTTSCVCTCLILYACSRVALWAESVSELDFCLPGEKIRKLFAEYNKVAVNKAILKLL